MVCRAIRAAGAALAIMLVWPALAVAAECPRAGTLGTSRVLSVDAVSYPRVGLKSFPQTLPLRDHEVVLTFDDGPSPPMTLKVLAALARECVRATFFLVGKPASEHANLVRRIAAEGHTVGHHSWMHRSLMRIKPSETTDEIDLGILAVEMALHEQATTTPSTPLPLSRLRVDAGDARFSAIARHRRVRHRSMGQRLEPDDAESGIEAVDRPAQGGAERNHPAARPEGPDRRDAAGFLALPAGK
jgi:peptidoglycan/xylan/chitin deacetylase (PgdA/CDA1 family)